MATYRKEKNIIFITLDSAKGEYCFDINTGVFYGLKGQPVKTIPSHCVIGDMFCRVEGSNLARVLQSAFGNNHLTSDLPRYVEGLQGADKLDALGIVLNWISKEQYAYLGDNIKFLKTYLEANHHRFNYHTFYQECEFEKVRNTLGSAVSQLTAEMYDALSCNGRYTYTAEELSVCAYYLVRGKYWEYHGGNLGTLRKYIELCRTMEKQPQKVNNFMREYCETKKTYELFKAEYDNKRLVANYAKHEKAWQFAYGDYIITIPTTAQDIVTEGKEMHHCVGSYVDRVVDGRDYICFVRHKDNPSIPYITCEVYTNGTIGQYFLAYDRYISSDEDKAFRKAFQEHLNSVWG